MIRRQPEAQRLKEDFLHSHRLGAKSTENLINFLSILASDIDDIRCTLKILQRKLDSLDNSG